MIGEIINLNGSKINGAINFSKLKNFDSKLTSNLYSIKYVEKGVEDYIINKKRVELTSNELIFVKPSEDIYVNINSKDYNSGVCIYLDKKPFMKYVCNDIPNQELIPDFKLSVVDTELAHFYKTIKSPTNNKPDQILKQFMLLYKKFLVKNSVRMECLANKEDTMIMLWKNLEKSKIFILNNFQNQIKLNDIAKSADMSLFHFQRTFKKFYNNTPNDYLKKVRLNHAMTLLNETNRDDRDVAFMSGFNDVKYFRKCIKKIENSN